MSDIVERVAEVIHDAVGENAIHAVYVRAAQALADAGLLVDSRPPWLAEVFGDVNSSESYAEAITRLRAVNAELLAALKTVTGLLEHMIHDEFDGTSLLAETLEPVIAARAVISKFDDAPSVSSVPDVSPRASGWFVTAADGDVGGVSVTSADVPKPAPEHSMWNGARI